jgi:hypothetical protein
LAARRWRPIVEAKETSILATSFVGYSRYPALLRSLEYRTF